MLNVNLEIFVCKIRELCLIYCTITSKIFFLGVDLCGMIGERQERYTD